MSDALRLLVYESYALDEVGGELRSVLHLLEHLDRAVLEPVVVLPFMVEAMRPEIDRGTQVRIIEAEGALREYGGAWRRGGMMGRMLWTRAWGRHVWRLIRELRRVRTAAVYCCSLRAVLLVGPAAVLTRTPVLFVVNGELANPVLDAVAFALADKIVFQCASNRDDRYPLLRRLFSWKLEVVQSGVDLEAIRRAVAAAPPPAALGIDPTETNVMVLGFLNPRKGIHDLLEALGTQIARLGRVRLWVVGGQPDTWRGGYARELRRLARRWGLDDRIEFTGWRADALHLLSAMDILVHPSLSEGMPRAVLEAMALGKAVVASRVGCSREVIRDGENGLLVEPGDPEGLGCALESLLGDPGYRASLGRAAAQTIREGFEIADKVDAIQTLLADLAGIGSKPGRTR